MTKLTFEQFIELRLLLSIEGIGPGKIRNLLARFNTTENIFTASLNSLIKTEGISTNLADRIRRVSSRKDALIKKVENEFKKLKSIGGKIITLWDTEYPELLKRIYDPPVILYMLGEFQESDKYSIAIVGTRKPTNYGRCQAERLASELSQQGITVVSGLARGIDSAAHKAVIKAGGRTLAITGAGLDVIYPSENKGLYEEIACKGAVITEFEPGTKPDAMNFPRRNRIISGLSLGTVVIETGIKGGAMQTASFAIDQNREVFALPGNVDVQQSEGTNLLIQKGEAKLIKCAGDILEELQLKLQSAPKPVPKPIADLDMFEERVIRSLNKEPKHIDIIAANAALTTAECSVYLLSLELKGLVKQYPGKSFGLEN